MTLLELEQIFNRAFSKIFLKKKILFLFPVLVTCGILTVFFRTLSLGVNHWVWMSLSFLPIFLSTGVLLAAGTLLVKMYICEIKGSDYQIKKILLRSLHMIFGVSYLCFPLILAYLILWSIMGFFYLLKQIPAFGDVFGSLFSFGPYILVLGSFILAITSILLLFFITPHVALKKTLHVNIAGEIISRMKKSIFMNGFLFFIGIIPLCLVLFFLILSAIMTGLSYFSAKAVIGISIQWIMIMIPFCFIMTPFVIFFFNFSLESYIFISNRDKRSVEKEKNEEPCLV